jgi:hypothetical protein
MASTINLLRPVEHNSSQLLTIKEEVRRIALICFVVSLAVGVITIAVTFILQISVNSQKETQTMLKSQLKEQEQKEQQIAVVKSRIAVVEKAMTYSKPVDQALGMVLAINSPPSLYSVSYDDQGKIVAHFKANSIPETMNMAETVLNFVKEKHIKNPKMDTYGLDKDGIRISFSFEPVWD